MILTGNEQIPVKKRRSCIAPDGVFSLLCPGIRTAGTQQQLAIILLRVDAAASAIEMTRPGAAEAIPTREEVLALLAEPCR